MNNFDIRRLINKRNNNGVQPVVAEYNFSPVHCYVTLSTHIIINEKWRNNALVRNGTRQKIGRTSKGIYAEFHKRRHLVKSY